MARTYVVGNATIDESFAVSALPHEGESVLAQRTAVGLGGKGANQAVVMARCGVPVTLIAAVGQDARGEDVRRGLDAEPLEARMIVRPGAATDVSMILADGAGGNVVVTTADCARSVTATDIAPHLGDAAPGDLLVLQGNLTPATTGILMDMAGARGLAVVLNPSPVDLAFGPLLGRAATVFLNRPEARTLTGETDTAALQALHARGVRTVVLTDGAAGALLSGPDGVTHVPASDASVVDVTGAGDTFQGAALASALRHGRDLHPDDLRVGARAAAFTISRPGTFAAFPDPATLAAFFNG